jgi:hypothetical protein
MDGLYCTYVKNRSDLSRYFVASQVDRESMRLHDSETERVRGGQKAVVVIRRYTPHPVPSPHAVYASV